ncbi:MAG: helix-turn-helix transcriptional regulator [Eubacteriales bacterium]|nr:helix-turn-helix transcriptional regulator [Eubacteriales bacterium]
MIIAGYPAIGKTTYTSERTDVLDTWNEFSHSLGGVMFDTASLGNRIRAFRESRGMTQEELAGAAGISVKHVSVLERGIKEPRLSTIVNVAEALKVTPNDLLLAETPNDRLVEMVRTKISQLPAEKAEKAVTIMNTVLEQIT